jgi:hypothetical protein
MNLNAVCRAVALALVVVLACAAAADARGTLTVRKHSGGTPVPMAGTVVGGYQDDGELEGEPVTAIDCGLTCSAFIPDKVWCKPNLPTDCFSSSRSVGLTATAASDWKFTGWSGACSGTGTSCSVSVSANRSVTANFSDEQAPSVELHGPAENAELRDSVSVTAKASDNWSVTKVEWLLDNVVVKTDEDWNADDLDNGVAAGIDVSQKPHADQIEVGLRAWDPAGKWTEVTRKYVIDRHVDGAFTPPTPAPGSWVTAGSPHVAFTYDADVVSRKCRTNGAAFADCDTGYAPPAARDGEYTVDVELVDEQGNTATLSRGFKVDRTAPTVSIATPANRSFRNSGFTPAFTASDAMTKSLIVTCAVDSKPFGACGPVGLLSDGAHDFSVKARDAAGHEKVATSEFTLDTVAPAVQITYGPAHGSIIDTPAATFGFPASDSSPIQYDCRLDRAPYARCGSPGSHALANLADGPHTFDVRVTDAAGNATQRSRGFTVNAVRPTVAITSGPADGSAVAETAVTFGFIAAGAVEVSCSLDSATSFRPCSGADYDALSRLGDGTHVFRVRARDEADEVVVAARTFHVDTSQPQTRIDAGPAEGSSTPAGNVTFAFSASVDGATFRCRFGKPGTLGPFGPCSGPGNTHAARGLAPGSYVFEVQAVNALGTPDASPERRTFKLTKPLPPLQFTVANFWTIHSRARTGVKELTVRNLPDGARVEVRCKGPRCPFKRDTAKVRKGKAALKKLFGKRKLGAGATIDIRVTAPGVDGRVVRFKIRKDKYPKRVELCLPQGTSKPTRC